jgi:hypothetical protein
MSSKGYGETKEIHGNLCQNSRSTIQKSSAEHPAYEAGLLDEGDENFVSSHIRGKVLAYFELCTEIDFTSGKGKVVPVL